MSRHDQKRRATWHVHTGDEKRLAVALTGGEAERKRGPHTSHPTPAPASFVNASGLSERTLRRYRKEIREEGDVHEPLPRGHPQPRLSPGEKRVVGGKVLWRWTKGKITDLEFVIAWVDEKFHVLISDTVASDILSSLHLVSKALTEKPLKYFNANMIDELWDFLKAVHTRYRQGLQLSQLVAIDVCYWTNSGVVQRTFGPQGRYAVNIFVPSQPHARPDSPLWVNSLFAALRFPHCPLSLQQYGTHSLSSRFLTTFQIRALEVCAQVGVC
jgi:hypothetical protein